ncbi:hypothetical protein F3157_14365 [Virgibacillus dakarensis]|uniref:Uncharacterized protein n=1 Tax=Lentibacillus populi TaxID=1827502 RepID=A0A9W5TWK8_9BACI|nr:hypothetical protein [Lentibacillus populi]MBT2218459.1 hypothetical protein [Virgibacillus dakarensis]MTW86835.1 hypothetical protein [Virgibacillus dakarensis]GGB37030.1 hypothetical protein GCM10011409_13080 [Lentibacillus populi]
MNKEMIDSLLKTITDMSDEVKDIQTSGYRLDEHVTDIEMRINDIGLGLSGLQRDIRNIDRDVTTVIDKLLEKNSQTNQS